MYYKLLILICLPFWLTAQDLESPIKFKNQEHQFGDIKEVDGKVSKRFYFQNISSQAVKLKDVFVACGCTSPEWPKREIKPNDTSSILVTFDPLDRPGEFDKYIRVEIENVGEPMYLVIKGNVLPRPPGPRDWFPFRLGNLWFKQQNMFVGAIYHDEEVEFKNMVYNSTDEPIQVTIPKKTLPKFIKMSWDKLEIPPKDSVHFSITYLANKRKDWGFLSDAFTIETSDSEEKKKELGVGAIINERFDWKEGQKAPKLEVAQQKFDFGEVRVGDQVKIKLELKNSGAKKLKIRKLNFSGCNCLSAQLPKMILKPNEKVEMEIVMETKELFGWQNRSVSLITNDPKNHLMDLRIEGNIVDSEN